MIGLALAPFVLSVVLWPVAPALAARCAPKWTVWSLTVLTLVAALATGLVLCAIAGLGFAEIPAVGDLGHWSAAALADRARVPAPLAAAAAVVAAILLGAAIVHLLRAVRGLIDAARSCRALGPGVGGLIVVDDDRVAAFAIPALRGRTVVSRALLRTLDADERRAVLSHESAHLRHRHFVYVQLVELAGAANPLLRPAGAAVRRAVESWADDDAAEAVGDRVCVARAVAKATLARRVTRPAGHALGVAATSDLAHRMRYLLDPEQRRTGRCVALMFIIATICAGSALAVGAHAHAMFEIAESAFAPSH